MVKKRVLTLALVFGLLASAEMQPAGWMSCAYGWLGNLCSRCMGKDFHAINALPWALVAVFGGYFMYKTWQENAQPKPTKKQPEAPQAKVEATVQTMPEPELDYVVIDSDKENTGKTIGETAKPNNSQKYNGSKNLTGSLCYFNSLLKALFNLDEFREACQKKKPAELEEQTRIDELKKKNELKDHEKTEFDDLPVYLKTFELLQEALKASDEGKEDYHQKLYDYLKDAKLDKTPALPRGQQDPSEIFSRVIGNISVFKALFKTDFYKQLYCKICEHVKNENKIDSHIIWQTHTLSPLNPFQRGWRFWHSETSVEKELEQALRNSGKNNEHDGSYCSHCKQNTAYSIEKLLPQQNAPKLLFIQLGRFDKDRNKVSLPCTIPWELTIEFFKNLEEKTKAEKIYRLVSCIIHSGERSNSGHYYTYTRCPDGKIRNFNDTTVAEVSRDRMNEIMSSGIESKERGAQPYLLIYRQIEKSSKTGLVTPKQ